MGAPLYTIGTRGTFYLVVELATAYMRLMCHECLHEYLKFSVGFGCRLHSGILVLVIRPLPLCAMSFNVIIFLLSQVIRSF